MCGILGEVSTRGVDREDFEERLLKMHHRGPDSSGTYFDDSVALGQTRLSIMDLSKDGYQPMVSSCGNYVIIYNGEIYNFKELRAQLFDSGIGFKSQTDTEVVLNGFIAFGERFVRQLNGMFAFSIYNKATKELFLARDKSGIKPLYYHNIDNVFSFSSELKAFPNYLLKTNFEAKILFLLLGYIPEPHTIYEKVFMFPAGYCGYYRKDGLTLEKFADYQYHPKHTKSYDEIVLDSKEIFNRSVERHMVSDAPIGVFLSGGLDSSAIVSAAAQIGDLHTVSLEFEDKDFCEKPFQELIARKFETKHTSYLVTEKIFMNTVDSFVKSMEQPTIDGLNTFLVSKAARKSGMKTVLSGIGGDEIFYGYPSFRDCRTLRFLSHIPYSLIKIFLFSKKYNKLELLDAENSLSYYLPRRALFSPSSIANILDIDRTEVYRLISNLWLTYMPKESDGIEDKISYYELNMYMKNQLLRDADVFGMANSLEIRVPFLDNDLVDYSLRVNPVDKMGALNKKLLVDLSQDLLPRSIAERKKMGFTLPFSKWFKDNIDYFDTNTNMKNKLLSGEVSWSRFWALHVLSAWNE